LALGTKMFVIMACITVVLWFAMPTEMASQENGTVTGFFGARLPNPNLTNGTVTFNGTAFTSGLDDSNATSIPIISGVINTVSDYMKVQSWVRTILSIFLAPMVFMAVIQAPSILVALFGIVWVLMYVIAIAGFMRGRDF
jgi:hypothetical protein